MASSRVPTTPRIKNLAKHAYIWGLAPEFVYRFEKYNDLVTAEVNTLGGGSGVAAAWNNNATNAGDASVLYLNSMMDLSGKQGRGGVKELVMTVPPSATDYYVVNLLDSFINTVGSIGTRTTPSTEPQTYLIAGPTLASTRSGASRGSTASGTGSCRPTRTSTGCSSGSAPNSLVAPSDPARRPTIQANVVERFALNTLAEFQANGNQPTYFEPGQYTPTDSRSRSRRSCGTTRPRTAIRFFKQVGRSLKLSPLPTAATGLNGIPLETLPPWVAPQADAGDTFRNPSFGQRTDAGALQADRPDRSRLQGSERLGQARSARALQRGFEAGAEEITGKLDRAARSRGRTTGTTSTPTSGPIPTPPRATSTAR